jgi:hypothetical protein
MGELVRKPASSTASGELTAGTQTIYGAKSFSGAITPLGGIIGKTDGIAVDSLKVGEQLTASRNSFYGLPSPVINTLYDIPSLSISLTAGVWALSLNGGVIRGAGSTNNFTVAATIRDGSNNVLACIESTSNAITTANSVSLSGLNTIVTTATNLTVKISGGIFQTGGSPPTGISGDFVLNAGGISAIISAVVFRATRLI